MARNSLTDARGWVTGWRMIDRISRSWGIVPHTLDNVSVGLDSVAVAGPGSFFSSSYPCLRCSPSGFPLLSVQFPWAHSRSVNTQFCAASSSLWRRRLLQYLQCESVIRPKSRILNVTGRFNGNRCKASGTDLPGVHHLALNPQCFSVDLRCSSMLPTMPLPALSASCAPPPLLLCPANCPLCMLYALFPVLVISTAAPLPPKFSSSALALHSWPTWRPCSPVTAGSCTTDSPRNPQFSPLLRA
jgi:hypothetical protein